MRVEKCQAGEIRFGRQVTLPESKQVKDRVIPRQKGQKGQDGRNDAGKSSDIDPRAIASGSERNKEASESE